MKLHTTIAKVQELLGVVFTAETSPNITAINGWIEDVSSELNELTQGKYDSEVVTDILDFDHEEYLLTKKSPISNVTVSYNKARFTAAPVWEELDLYLNYTVEPSKGRITLNKGSFKPGKGKFKITYTSGLDDTPYWLRNLATRMVALKVMSASLNNRVVNSEDASQIRVGQVSVIKPSDFGIGNFDSLHSSIQKDLDDLKSSVRGVRYVNY